ncbi:MAG: rhomboid family intramembrane serine protease, partial [Vicinamibacterales bacterium]
RRHPGMWGLAPLLRHVGDDMGFAMLVTWACGALYLACLASDPEGVSNTGLLSFLSPSFESLLRFGASGAGPVLGYGHWWTLLSAGWLHGSVLHILFNMLWVRDLAPPTARLYGPGRTVIVYTVAGVCGFAASSLAGVVPFLPPFLQGAGVTVGASAPIFGLIGALLHYGRRGGSSHISQQAKSLAITMLLFGFIMPGVDNWAHLGGLGGGYLAAKLLDPLQPERGNHVIAALACLLLSLVSVVLSVATGIQAQG